MWIERNNTDKLISAVNQRPVVLLTGMRQVGKSSLLKRIFPNATYITLDRIAIAEEAEVNPMLFLDRFNKQVIIDEIQYAPSLFRHLKLKVDQERQQNGKWILTGSQQFNLMHHISESLAGRVRILNLHTLNASELSQTRFITNHKDLIWKGGFPEIWASQLDANEYFDDYIQTYLERDLRQIINVTNLRDFRRFLGLLVLRTSQLLNYSEISKEIGVAVNTIKAWVNALETTGMIILLPPYYSNLGKRLIKTPKLYFSDNGLAAALLGIDSLETLNNSPFQGALWENFVLNEFLKSGVTPGKNIFFVRDQNGFEIDFVIEKAGIQYWVEAKQTEIPNSQKLNFSKFRSHDPEQVKYIVACTTQEKGLIELKDYAIYNPLFGIPPF